MCLIYVPVLSDVVVAFLVFCLCRYDAFSIFAGVSVLSPSLSFVIPLVLIVNMMCINLMQLIHDCEFDNGCGFDDGYKCHWKCLPDCCYNYDYDYGCGCGFIMIIIITLIVVSIAISLRLI